jgi:hypothetical protein
MAMSPLPPLLPQATLLRLHLRQSLQEDTLWLLDGFEQLAGEALSLSGMGSAHDAALLADPEPQARARRPRPAPARASRVERGS